MGTSGNIPHREVVWIERESMVGALNKDSALCWLLLFKTWVCFSMKPWRQEKKVRQTDSWKQRGTGFHSFCPPRHQGQQLVHRRASVPDELNTDFHHTWELMEHRAGNHLGWGKQETQGTRKTLSWKSHTQPDLWPLSQIPEWLPCSSPFLAQISPHLKLSFLSNSCSSELKEFLQS